VQHSMSLEPYRLHVLHIFWGGLCCSAMFFLSLPEADAEDVHLNTRKAQRLQAATTSPLLPP